MEEPIINFNDNYKLNNNESLYFKNNTLKENIINFHYEYVILPITSELLSKIYNIIYLMKKKYVKKNICDSNRIIFFYKIINNYSNKINNIYDSLIKDKNNFNNSLYNELISKINLEINIIQKNKIVNEERLNKLKELLLINKEQIFINNNNELYNQTKKRYEDAILFTNLIIHIFVNLNKKYFYDDLYDSYYYYYNMVNNNIESDIYNKNFLLLKNIDEFYNKYSIEYIKTLNNLENINTSFIDNEINNIKINNTESQEILKNFEININFIKSKKSNIISYQKNNISNNDIISKKQNLMIKRKYIKCEKNIIIDNLPEDKIEKYNFNDIIFQIDNNETKYEEFKKNIIFNNDDIKENDDNDDNDDINIFRGNLINTFQINNKLINNNNENINNIKSSYKNFYDNKEKNVIKNYKNNSIASLFSFFILKKNNFLFADNDNYSIDNYIFIDVNKTEIKEFGIDYGNIRKEFIISLINELFDKNIFIMNNSKKYFLNAEYIPDNTFINILNKNNNEYYKTNFIDIKNININFYKDFFKFISNLMTFLLFNNYNLDKEISSYLLACFYKKEITDYDYVYYYIKDFNNDKELLSNELFYYINIDDNALNENQEIHIFNNEYLLDNNYEHINSSNRIKYIIELSKFIMTKTIKKRESIIDIKEYNKIINIGENINKIFKDSIPEIIKNDLNNIKNINNDLIHKLLIKPKLDDELIKTIQSNLVNNIIYNTIKIKDENILIKQLNKKKLLILVYIIISNILIINDDNNNFIEKLLLFWSSSHNYDNIEYKINANNTKPYYYSTLNLIIFPDYFKDLEEEEIDNIYNDILNPDKNPEEYNSKHKSLIKLIIKNIKTSVTIYHNKKNDEVKGGSYDTKKYTIYKIDNRYFINYNNKRHYLNLNNIIKKNNSYYTKIGKKYIKISLK